MRFKWSNYLRFEGLQIRKASVDWYLYVKGHFFAIGLTTLGSALGLPLARFWAGADMTQEFWMTVALSLVGPSLLLFGGYFFFLERAASRLYFDKEVGRPNTLEIANIKHDVNIREALDLIGVSSELNKENVDHSYRVTQNLRQFASLGSIAVWGRSGSSHLPPDQRHKLLERIPAEYWKDHDIDGLEAMKRDNWRDIQTRPMGTTQYVHTDIFCDLWLSKAEIEVLKDELNQAPK